ncbi:hypothetical protein N7540_011203 [Penicillium herquei]|nr:hypothetical protein N7540_013232 [Penicillium herquei]KAJ6004717.1 hypothetical protein N7540_013086 [Penicillium herquei]KAJ6016612.1 hypothetical protein N7540_011203 [Penicillium herquei]
MSQKTRLSCTEVLRLWYTDIISQLDPSFMNEIYKVLSRISETDLVSDMLRSIKSFPRDDMNSLINQLARKTTRNKTAGLLNLKDPQWGKIFLLLPIDERWQLWMSINQYLPTSKKANRIGKVIQGLTSHRLQCIYSHLQGAENQLQNLRAILEVREMEEKYERGELGNCIFANLYLTMGSSDQSRKRISPLASISMSYL